MLRRNAVGNAQHYDEADQQTRPAANRSRTTEAPEQAAWRTTSPFNRARVSTRRERTQSNPSSISDPKPARTHPICRPCIFRSPNLPNPNAQPQTQAQLTLLASIQSTTTATTTTPSAITNINSTSKPSVPPTTTTTPNGNEAATKLAEALDDFLSDVERKFKGISEEIMARLDEMTERCDRLETELLRKEAGVGARAGVGGSVGSAVGGSVRDE